VAALDSLSALLLCSPKLYTIQIFQKNKTNSKRYATRRKTKKKKEEEKEIPLKHTRKNSKNLTK